MGAWGAGPFENDDALDFLGDLREATPTEIAEQIAAAISAVLAPEDPYVDAGAMSIAVAAASLIAVRAGAPAPPDPAVSEWLEAAAFGASDEMRAQAKALFDRALDPTDNEWFDLWVESDAIDEARAAVEPYRAAVTDVPAERPPARE
jgi:hypothetical protein